MSHTCVQTPEEHHGGAMLHFSAAPAIKMAVRWSLQESRGAVAAADNQLCRGSLYPAGGDRT